VSFVSCIVMLRLFVFFFFFFQAEDGIRDFHVTGVQTCALPIYAKIELTFARVLRAALRQDPDIVLVGEIRDQETAEIALRAALTGHLVLSTLHTNDALTSAMRLIDMGVEPFLVATALNAVLAQRLIRRVCENCLEDHQPDPRQIAWLENLYGQSLAGTRFKRGSG